MAGVSKSELVCGLTYACQGRIALQKSINDDFDGKEDQIQVDWLILNIARIAKLPYLMSEL